MSDAASDRPKVNDKLHLRSDVRVERLDDEVAVLDTRSDAVHRLTGNAVSVIDLLIEGVESDDVPDSLEGAVDELVAAGLVSNSRAWTRRRFMKMAGAGGAAFAAASVTTFALADPAAASTMCAAGWTATAVPQMYTTPGTHTFNTGPAGGTMANTTYSLLIRAWGAGGGGGGGSVDSTGGGGGGGEYRGGQITVTECTMYTVTVGAGGGGGGMPGVTGGDSSFGLLLVAKGGAGGTEPDSGSGTGGAGGTGGTGGTGYAGGMGGGGGGTGYNNYGAGGGGGGAGGASSAGTAGGNGDDNNGGGTGGTGGGTAPNMGGNGGTGGNDSNSSGTAAVAPGGGGGGAEEALLGATGGMGADGAVWVGV